jgi:hypothetical protein
MMAYSFLDFFGFSKGRDDSVTTVHAVFTEAATARCPGTHGSVQVFSFQTTVELRLSERWLSGSAWSFGQICTEFYKTNLP